MVQFFSENGLLLDEDILEIIRSAEVPPIIDQIWVAKRDWIDENNYQTIWELAR
jgi:hypothetical protein